MDSPWRVVCGQSGCLVSPQVSASQRGRLCSLGTGTGGGRFHGILLGHSSRPTSTLASPPQASSAHRCASLVVGCSSLTASCLSVFHLCASCAHAVVWTHH